jgi:hypothetical protein
MKARGRKIGESAGTSLLEKMTKAVPAGKDVRFHLMGHSFGCIVVAGMVHGERGPASCRGRSARSRSSRARRRYGVLQGHSGGRQARYFRKVIDENKISGPIPDDAVEGTRP